MEIENRFAEYVVDGRFEDLPETAIAMMKNIVLGIIGTTIAGANEDGCEQVLNLVREWGGKEEATILVYDGHVPAHNAALVNSIMARALDFNDMFSGGVGTGCHTGPLTIPAALATAELLGGCTGKEFLAALILGTEIAARIHANTHYDGVEGTGVCGIFASTAIAGKLLGLNREQMLNALGLALNRASGSLQNYIERALAIRMVEGFTSQSGIVCAQLAQRGITGPREFLDGTYGWFHLYDKGKCDRQALVSDLGDRFQFAQATFKRYPTCGGTTAAIDTILYLIKEAGLRAEDVERIDIKMPKTQNLAIVGRPFEIGDNPKAAAQFSIRYCVASTLLRKSCKLEHFDEVSVRDPEVMELVRKIDVSGHSSAETTIDVTTGAGKVYHQTAGIQGGVHENLPTREEHINHFRECFNYAEHVGNPLPKRNMEKIISLVSRLENMKDITKLLPLLVNRNYKSDLRVISK